ncbi:radical SAM protein [Candidatus Shapirobacteria bacterium]|nr:radical SAM protein [Candidatus Shapirobacteria bacterium]
MFIIKLADKKVYDYRQGPDCVVWEITLACNLRCVHCGVNAAFARESELSLKDCLMICQQLKEIKTKYITLMGGELFLRKDWETIARKIRQLGMKLTIVSNGWFIDRAMIKKLKELNLYHLVISLDGEEKVHDYIRGVKGAFGRAAKAIDLGLEAGVRVGIITTLSRFNLFELKKIRRFVLDRRGALKWQVQVASCHGGRMKPQDRLSLKEFYFLGAFINETMKKYSFLACPLMGAHDIGYYSRYFDRITEYNHRFWEGCTAGVNTLGISSNGNVKGCLSLSDEFIEDNIKNRSLVEIWYDPKAFVMNRHFKKRFLKGFCAHCPHKESCEGGCSDLACSFSGSAYSDPYCFYRLEKQGFK